MSSSKALAWLSNDYLAKVIANHEKSDQLRVVSFEVQPAVESGENYASQLFRVQVEFVKSQSEHCRKSYIFKATVEGGAAIDALSKYDTHNKEMRMYGEILPKCLAVLAENGDHDSFFPATLFADREKDVIIFEDLKERGFVNADRQAGLDMTHAKMTLEKLTKFHAASMVLHERDGYVFEGFMEGIVNRGHNSFDPFFRQMLEVLTEEVYTWPGYEYYADKLKRTQSFLTEGMCRAFDRNEGDFMALAHGDFWLTNAMFKHDRVGRPTDVILIDFQFCVYTCPVVDLLYFFGSSLTVDLRLNSMDELIRFYHEKLTYFLKKYKFRGQIPTLFNVQRQFWQRSFYCLAVNFLCFAVMSADSEANLDMEKLLQYGDEAAKVKRSLVQNPRFQNMVKTMLPFYDRKGVLDPLFNDICQTE